MTKVEIENELRRLRMQLEQYYSKRAKRTKERDEMERIINELHKKEQEIEKGIQQTLTTIKARVDKLNKKVNLEFDMWKMQREFFIIQTLPMRLKGYVEQREKQRIGVWNWMELLITIIV